jgi:hypothetical protein
MISILIIYPINIAIIIVFHIVSALSAVYLLYKTEQSQFVKVTWTLLILFIPFVFSILYFFKNFIEKQNLKNLN